MPYGYNPQPLFIIILLGSNNPHLNVKRKEADYRCFPYGLGRGINIGLLYGSRKGIRFILRKPKQLVPNGTERQAEAEAYCVNFVDPVIPYGDPLLYAVGGIWLVLLCRTYYFP
jgi:hypothetical protein